MKPSGNDAEQTASLESTLLNDSQSFELFPEDSAIVSQLYTVAMMADVLGVSQATIRHWHRNKLIRKCF